MMPARELYCSDWFRKARAYAEKISDEWFILSAKYALLDPNQIIEPYDKTLRKMPISARREWVRRVLSSLDKVLHPQDCVVVLASVSYREFLIEPLRERGRCVKIPMKGLVFGKQLRWLGKKLGNDEE